MDDENKFNEKYRGLIVHAIVRINRNNIFELNFFFLNNHEIPPTVPRDRRINFSSTGRKIIITYKF